MLNIHWGFSLGGIAQYATVIEQVRECAPIEISSVCIINRKRHVDERSLGRLKGLTIIERNGPLDFGWVRRLNTLIEKRAPDLVFTHGFNGHFAACVARALGQRAPRYIASYHGRYHPPTRLKRLVARLYNRFTEWYLRRVAASVVTVAECGKRYLVSRGVAATKIRVAHNGIPDVAQEGDVGGLRRDLGLPDDGVVIGIVSRLEPIKGVSYLLEAFARVAGEYPDAVLSIIGSGVQEEYLRQLASRLAIAERVRFAGFRPDAARYLPAIDIFVLPSLSEFHSIGLLEAMRAAKAIIATDVGGNTESTRHEKEALIVPPADSAAIEFALERLFADPELRDLLGQRARERFLSEFTADRMVGRTAKWLERIVAQSASCC